MLGRPLAVLAYRKLGTATAVVLDHALHAELVHHVDDVDTMVNRVRASGHELYAIACDALADATQVWARVRECDAATPVLLVVEDVWDTPPAPLHPELDLAVHISAGFVGVQQGVKRLVELAENRFLAAQAEEARAIAEDINARIKEREADIEAARKALASLDLERKLRVLGERVFMRHGGTPVAFRRLWPDTYSSVVRDCLPPPERRA